MPRSFLFDVCDFHLSYLGCRDKEPFIIADLYLLILYAMTAVSLFLFVGMRVRKDIRKGLKFREALTDIDGVSLIGGMSAVFRVAMLQNLRYVGTLDLAALTDLEAQDHVRRTIVLEFVELFFGALAMSGFASTMVKTATGADLFDPIQIGSRMIDISRVLRVFRLFVLLCNITFVCLFAIPGLNGTLYDYIYYRRLFYGFPAIVSILVSLPLLSFFGTRIIRALNEKLPSFVSTTDGFTESTKKSLNSTEDKKQKQLLLRISVYGVMAMYAFAALYCSSVVIINEMYASNHQILYLTKMILDVFYWIVFAWSST